MRFIGFLQEFCRPLPGIPKSPAVSKPAAMCFAMGFARCRIGRNANDFTCYDKGKYPSFLKNKIYIVILKYTPFF